MQIFVQFLLLLMLFLLFTIDDEAIGGTLPRENTSYKTNSLIPSIPKL